MHFNPKFLEQGIFQVYKRDVRVNFRLTLRNLCSTTAGRPGLHKRSCPLQKAKIVFSAGTVKIVNQSKAFKFVAKEEKSALCQSRAWEPKIL